jgi:prevent-host-death family protein
MKIAPVADVKARFSKYLEDCAKGPVVVTKNGRPAAVLVAVTDEEELERLVLAHTPRFVALLDAAHDRIRKGGGMKHEDFWKAAAKKRP